MSRSSSFCARKSRRNNPFSNCDRENFPNLDDFFGTAPNQIIDSMPSHDDGESSVLNMSIGARAALTEHLRHVSKYGLDGELPAHDEAAPRTVLEQKWEHFLEHQSTTRDTSMSRSGIEIFSTASSCLEQSIEVMTDISHDFFNSSRVQLLVTPERNRSRVHHVSTRGQMDTDEDQDEDDFFTNEEPAETLAPELLVMQSSSSEEHHHSSFLSSSFCAPDISRISSADDSEPRALQRSPNTSFQFHHNILRLDDDPNVQSEKYGDSPLFSSHLSSPAHVSSHQNHLETSFASMQIPTRSSSENQRIWSKPLFGMHSSFCEPSTSKNSILPRRSFSAPGLCVRENAGKENQNPRSSILAHVLTRQLRCHNEKGQLSSTHHQSSTEQRMSALETLSTDFLQAIELARVDESSTLSPISQVGSSHIGIFYESSSSSSRRRRQMQRTSPYPPVASTAVQDTSTSSSSSSLTGRKRFRTVVPRRVYMNSPSQFPDEQDSFGHSSPDHTSESPAQRSLLDSFEAAVDEYPTSGCSACYTY